MSGADNYPEALISTSYHIAQAITLAGADRKYLPHTAIKHTVYIHCTSSYTSDIMDSIVWVYDNTRGPCPCVCPHARAKLKLKL